MIKYILILIDCFIGIVGGNFYVRKICKYLNLPEENKESLLKAGRIIGYLERFIILTFFFFNSYQGIGLIFTGKSIIRLYSRKESEYYLVGTLASFSWAILWGVVLKFIIKL